MYDNWVNENNTLMTSNFKVGDKYASIIQGATSRDNTVLLNEGDPSSMFYTGVTPQTAMYNLSTDTYIRQYGTNDVTPNFSQNEQQEITEIEPTP